MVEKVRAAIGLILNSREEALFQKKDSGYHWHPNQWCFFGGEIEEGEKSINTFYRELEEEIGEIAASRVINAKLFWEFGYRDVNMKTGDLREGIMVVHTALFDGNVSDIRVKEGAGFVFLSRGEMDYHPIVWHNRRVIESYYDTLLENQLRDQPQTF